jgi:hypothetical protein
MQSLRQSLLNAERLDLAAVLARRGDELPFLRRLSDFPFGESGRGQLPTRRSLLVRAAAPRAIVALLTALW